MLGVRILPRHHELFAGYLLRLADANGLTSISHLLKIISDEKIKAINLVKWSSSQISKLLPKLAIALDIPLAELETQLVGNEPPFGYSSNREICSDIRFEGPRFCIDCIIEGAVIDRRSALPLFESCHKHNRSFISNCPSCGHRFDWHTFIYDGCRKCGLLWHDFDNTKESLASPLEKSMWDEVINITEKTDSKVSDIIQTIFAIARPYDTFPDRFYTLPLCLNINDHIRKAYRLLESRNAVDEWKASCVEYRSPLSKLGNKAIFAPITKWANNLTFFDIDNKNEEPILAYVANAKSVVFIESKYFIRASRAKILATPEDTAARYHVNRRQLESYLGFKDKDLFCSIQSNTLPAINGTSISRDQIFNLIEVTKRIVNIRIKSTQKLTNLSCYEKLIRMHLCDRGMLINAVLCRDVLGEITISDNDAKIFVEDNSLRKWLSTQFSRTCENNVSLVKAATALCCGPKRIKSLVQDGSLHYPAWSRRTEEISGESLKSYWFKHHKITVNERVKNFTSSS